MKDQPTIDEIFKKETLITRAVRTAAREAAILHKRLGNPVTDYRDGKVVLIQPEDIVIPPPIEEPSSESDAA